MASWRGWGWRWSGSPRWGRGRVGSPCSFWWVMRGSVTSDLALVSFKVQTFYKGLQGSRSEIQDFLKLFLDFSKNPDTLIFVDNFAWGAGACSRFSFSGQPFRLFAKLTLSNPKRTV